MKKRYYYGLEDWLLWHWQGVLILYGIDNCTIPFTKPVVVNTALALPRSPLNLYSFTYFFTFFSETHRRRIITLDCSNNAYSCKSVPIAGILDAVPHFRVLSTKNPILRRQWAFSSQTCKVLKVSYYRQDIIEFNQVLQNDGWSQSRTTNHRWRSAPFKKNR